MQFARDFPIADIGKADSSDIGCGGMTVFYTAR